MEWGRILSSVGTIGIILVVGTLVVSEIKERIVWEDKCKAAGGVPFVLRDGRACLTHAQAIPIK